MGTLEIRLTTTAKGIALQSTSFRRASGTKDGNRQDEEATLIVSDQVEAIGIEPNQSERLRAFGDPQRAVLVLLLRAFGSQFQNASLPPQLARSLVGVLRKQMSGDVKSYWLSSLVGLEPREQLKDWFLPEGNTSRKGRCAVRLGPKWKSVSLLVTINKCPTPVPGREYEDLARAIEQGDSFPEPTDAVSINSFQLLVWNGALGCFAQGRDTIRQGDHVQLQVSTNQKIYLYALWVDQKGHVVTLYPWTGARWEWPSSETAQDALTIPDPARDGEGHTLRVEGAAGIEHVIVLAARQKLTLKDRQRLRCLADGMMRKRNCPSPETIVISIFDKRPRDPRQLRIIRRLEVPKAVRDFQAQVASLFTFDFDQVLICTIRNDG
jgi:hypothetical protein